VFLSPTKSKENDKANPEKKVLNVTKKKESEKQIVIKKKALNV
jgi:hypothetical protein